MKRTVEEYMANGFDRDAAEYFANGRRTITQVVPNDDYTLTLFFDNGEKRLFDMKPLLQKGTVFEPFLNLADFRRVYLDECNCVSWDRDPNVDSNVVWNNKVDLCGDSCYLKSTPIQ